MAASHRALVPMSTALVLSSGTGAVHQRHYYGHSGGIPSGQPLNNSFVVFPEFYAVERIVRLCPEHILTRARGWWYRSCGHTERGSLSIGSPFLASEG